MNKNYLIFRTDRIGDYLLTNILIKAIKRSDPNSKIDIVASVKNFSYIKSFININKVYLLKHSLINKIDLILNLRKINYDYVIIHDRKSRSKLVSFFLKRKKIIQNNKNFDSFIDDIKLILNKLNLNFYEDDLNSLKNSKKNISSKKNLHSNYINFHFDEKWISKYYIQSYTNIEPNLLELGQFIKNIALKSNKKIIITTGNISLEILARLKEIKFNKNIIFIDQINFLDLELITSKSDLLICCHGALSHVAAAYNIKQFDIIEESKSSFYYKWTKHFRNYNVIYRKNFSQLSLEILDKL